MSEFSASSRFATITVRLWPDEKLRFAQLAVSRGLSEAALAAKILRDALALEAASPPTLANLPHREWATDRITVRLRPGDGAALNARAAARRIKTSTYLAALVRSHIGAERVLTAEELHAVKQCIVLLTGIGRTLSRMTRYCDHVEYFPPELRQALAQTRTLLATVEDRTCKLARAALKSWESRYE
ncbi:MAG TPA: hypothetical protein VJ738_04640 [Steroidobacteraceae bacterium]|nr:hypothetical protein [Steroidobacteraceae bacterium]